MARRIIIIDGTATHRIAFKAALAAARYQVATACTGKSAMVELDRAGADVMIVAAELPDLASSGLLDRIGDRALDTPPCLIVTERDDTDLRANWICAGAAAAMVRPVARPWLLSNLRAILRAHEGRLDVARQVQTASRIGFVPPPVASSEPPRIDIVARDRFAAGRHLQAIGQQMGYDIAARSPEQCLLGADNGKSPDLVLLALDHSADEALWLVSEIRAHPDLRRAAIVVEAEADDVDRAARALDLGANAVLRTDAGPDERAAILWRELSWKIGADQKRAQLESSIELAATDHLTGLWNRRYAMHYLGDLAQRRHVVDRGYGIIVADIDHFKAVNDTYGHVAGDAILKGVAHRLQANLRDHDLVARIGGEEFLVALADTSDTEALIAAERLREAVATEPFRIGDAEITITLSLGIARGTGGDIQSTIAAADTALYHAKRAGRDRTRLASPHDHALAAERLTDPDHGAPMSALDADLPLRSTPAHS